MRLELEPVEAALARRVRGRQRLRHQALVAGRDRLVEEALGLLRVARDDARQQHLRADDPLQPLDALGVGARDERALVPEIEQVEEEGRQRDALARRLDVQPPAEPPHRLLERPRPTVRAERDRLALDHDLAHGQPSRPLHHLGHARGDVLQVACEDPHLVARPVHLQPHAVHLVLEGRLAEPIERLLRVVGRVREHRRDRREELQRESREPGAAFVDRRARDRADFGGEHRRRAHLGGRKRCRLRDRLEHQAVERALAHLAGQQREQELAARRVRALEHRAQSARAPLGRSLPFQRRDLAEGSVEAHERQRLPHRRPRRHGILQAPVADPDPALRERARQVQRDELDLALAGLPQQLGDQRDLLGLLRGGAEPRDEPDERGKLHAWPRGLRARSRSC